MFHVKQSKNFNEVIMLDLDKIRKELEQKAELKYIKLMRKNQSYYYHYKNLDIVLRIDIVTNKPQYISITRKAY